MIKEQESITPKSVLKNLSADIARQTAEFLAKGGQVQLIEAQNSTDAALWLTTKEAAQIIGVTVAKLDQWKKSKSSTPKYINIGGQVRWFLPSVEAFATQYVINRSKAA